MYSNLADHHSIGGLAIEGNRIARSRCGMDNFHDLALAGPLVGMWSCVLKSVNRPGITFVRL